jgi:hypothetical protein
MAENTEKDETLLDQLKAVVAKKVERPQVFIEVPERPGVKLLISPNVTQQQIRAWQKQCGSETQKGLDATKFACTVIGQTAKGVFLNGEEVLEDGQWPLTFASKPMLDMTGADRAIPDCVQKFFGLDAHVEAAALAIIDACGFGDTIQTEATENPSNQQ